MNDSMDTQARITAQVATEAIINAPEAYQPDTMRAVLDHAIAVGVAGFYTGQLSLLCAERQE